MPIKEWRGRFTASRNKRVVGLIDHVDEVTQSVAKVLQAECKLLIRLRFDLCLGEFQGTKGRHAVLPCDYCAGPTCNGDFDCSGRCRHDWASTDLLFNQKLFRESRRIRGGFRARKAGAVAPAFRIPAVRRMGRAKRNPSLLARVAA